MKTSKNLPQNNFLQNDFKAVGYNDHERDYRKSSQSHMTLGCVGSNFGN